MLTDSLTLSPLNAGEYFAYMEFNPCDSYLYGLIWQGKFARVNPANGAVTVLATGLGLACGSCAAAIDPYKGIYYFSNGHVIQGLSLTTYQVVETIPVKTGTERFENFSFNCMDSTLYGVSADPTLWTKYLSKYDTVLQQVVHISAINNLNNHIWKDAGAGHCLNPYDRQYYYMGMVKLLLGVDLNNGALGYQKQLNLSTTEHFEFMTYYPQCACGGTVISPIDEVIPSISPNPSNSMIYLNGQNLRGEKALIEVTDLFGKVLLVREEPINSNGLLDSEIYLPNLETGIYFVSITAENQKLLRKLMVN